MVLSLPLGTVLRQRYLIQQVLGQGGFGRTYLALDQERFNERCVLKEFTVPYQDDALVQKSKTLFEREASTLHQLQHPQVPQFWAAFEDEQRLFLVQSYIEGQTYRQLLSDRKQQGQTFTEAEILYFLNHLLPVLTYIHERDIIHRDISPENIILQTRSSKSVEPQAGLPAQGLPVLIDFGAVKEATSHWPLTSAVTRVGKVGYAPPEQLQTGTVYPNSDLYALAATSLALLTGKEPRSLLDGKTLTWQWQSYANISDELAAVLRKMLSVYSGDRYQSAREVLAELQPLLERTSSGTQFNPAPFLPADQHLIHHTSQATPATEMQSEVGYSLASNPPAEAPIPAHAANASRRLRSRLRAQWRVGLVASLLVGLGVSIPFLWRASTTSPDPNGEVWVSGAKLPRSEASRIIESQGANTNNALAKPDQPKGSVTVGRPAQPIQFPPGKIATVVQGTLQNEELQPYVLKASQGQIMTVTLEGQNVAMNLLRSNQEAVDAAAYQTRSWTGQLPADDQYQIQVSGSGAYTLDIAITPSSRPSQAQTELIAFAPGATGTSVTGTLSPKQLRRYLLSAKQGQLLVTKVLKGTVKLSTIAPNGQRIGGSATDSQDWQGRLPMDGDYVIEVSTHQAGKYALSFELF